MPLNRFPGNARFAFTVFDDTDWSTVENVRPVYRLLSELGMRITKSVWPLATMDASIGGSSLQEPVYRQFIRELQSDGHEIGLHGVRNCDSDRSTVQQGLAEFCDVIGHAPNTHANHNRNRDNLYWGDYRLNSSTARLVYNVGTRYRNHEFFQGQIDTSPWFWGDLCRQQVRYVRNFVFDDINLDHNNPIMPYHDPAKPMVNFWFSSVNGQNPTAFRQAICEPNQDRLEAEQGVCIMYTHFALGFCKNGAVDASFEALMRRLAAKKGWFVPVTVLLDHLRQQRGDATIGARELRELEHRWLRQQFRKRSGLRQPLRESANAYAQAA